MSKPITISFYGTQEIKTRLEQIAQRQDRSVSSVIRRLIANTCPQCDQATIPDPRRSGARYCPQCQQTDPCAPIDDGRLTHHPYVISRLNRLLRRRWLHAALGGGLHWTGLQALPCDDGSPELVEGLPDDVICAPNSPRVPPSAPATPSAPGPILYERDRPPVPLRTIINPLERTSCTCLPPAYSQFTVSAQYHRPTRRPVWADRGGARNTRIISIPLSAIGENHKRRLFWSWRIKLMISGNSFTPGAVGPTVEGHFVPEDSRLVENG
jgi:hypothetical protein